MSHNIIFDIVAN